MTKPGDKLRQSGNLDWSLPARLRRISQVFGDALNNEAANRIEELERELAEAEAELERRQAKIMRLTQSAAEHGERPCATCNNDPAVCATVPGLRHCEKATRDSHHESATSDAVMQAAIKAVDEWAGASDTDSPDFEEAMAALERVLFAQVNTSARTDKA